MSEAGTSERMAKVPTMYIRAIRAPAPKTARGSVLRGSRTSSLMAETSSSPVKAKAICDQKLTVSQFHVGSMFWTVKCVAEPCLKQTIAAMTASITRGTYVPTPPAFCNHLPTFSPTMFSTTATRSMARETVSRNVRSCASAAPRPPMM